MSRLLSIGAALLLAGCMPADDKPPADTATAASDLFGTDAHLTPSAPDEVLRYADHPRGFAELRLPKGAGPFPLAVIFHGGCWKTGIASQAYMAPLATRWQQQGVATLNVDYREVGDGGGWPGSFVDWQAAAGLIAETTRKFPLDAARVTLVGHSAGATAAQWLAAGGGGLGPTGPRKSVRPMAIIVLDGIADPGREAAGFDKLCQFTAVAPFMGGTRQEQPERYHEMSPDTHPPLARSMLFVQAVLPAPPAEVQSTLRATVPSLTVRANPGASHFAIITPGSPEYAHNEPAMLALLRGEPQP